MKILSQKIGTWHWRQGPDNLIQICVSHQQNNKYLKLLSF